MLKSLPVLGACIAIASANDVTHNDVSFAEMATSDWAQEQIGEGRDYDFLKTHGCNCPAVYGEFAIGGEMNDRSDIDWACHRLRECMSCTFRHDDCKNKDNDGVSFEWLGKNNGKAQCGVNADGCAAKKCECHVYFMNYVNKKYNRSRAKQPAPILVNANDCTHTNGYRDKCCFVNNDWKLYNSTDSECTANGVEAIGRLATTPAPADFKPYVHCPAKFTDVDTTKDYEIEWFYKTPQTASESVTSYTGHRTILRVGRVNDERRPGIYFLPSTRKFHVSWECYDKGSTWEDFDSGISDTQSANYEPNKVYKINVRVTKTSENKVKLEVLVDDTIVGTRTELDRCNNWTDMAGLMTLPAFEQGCTYGTAGGLHNDYQLRYLN